MLTGTPMKDPRGRGVVGPYLPASFPFRMGAFRRAQPMALALILMEK